MKLVLRSGSPFASFELASGASACSFQASAIAACGRLKPGFSANTPSKRLGKRSAAIMASLPPFEHPQM